jgi:hypothetical protein
MTKLLRPGKAAEYLDIDAKTLTRLTEEDPNLRAVYLHGRRRYRQEDLDAFVATLSDRNGLPAATKMIAIPVGSVPPWMEHWRKLDKGDIKFYAFKDNSKYDYDRGIELSPAGAES